MAEYNINLILEIYEDELSKTEVARKYCEKTGIKYTDNIRRVISYIINRETNKDINISTKQTKARSKLSIDKDGYIDQNTTEIQLDASAWSDELNRYLSVEEFCEKYGLPYDDVISAKLITHNANNMTYNLKFKKKDKKNGITKEFIEKTINKYIDNIEPIAINRIPIKFTSYIDRLVLTDIHIGMDTGGGRNTKQLYDVKWDKDELYQRLSQVFDHIEQHKRSDTIIVDELGDYLDGLDQETTRGGHKLPQNMDDKEAFEIAIDWKLKLIDFLFDLGYTTVLSNNVTNDNHSGTFGYFVNYTIKRIVEAKYGTAIMYNIMEQFMNYYKINKFTFILCHGKDDKDMKFGFKPFLDPKQAEKIDQYCKANYLYDGNYIEFSKGDSHQGIFDYTTSNDFDYCNYPAFSPPSNWVMTNFKKSKSGVYFYNLEKGTGIKITIPYWFK